MIKKIFKFRMLHLKWFTFYLFPRQRYDIAIGLDISDGDYPLFFINLIFIGMDITFAPDSWFNPSQEEKSRIEGIRNLSDKERCELIAKNLHDSVFGESNYNPHGVYNVQENKTETMTEAIDRIGKVMHPDENMMQKMKDKGL